MDTSRKAISAYIESSLIENKEQLKIQFAANKNTIGFFYLDGIFPEQLAQEIFTKFPTLNETKKKKDFREHKYVGYQMNKYDPLLEEVIYAFQDKKIVQLISEICQIKDLIPDENLYAGGISLMKKDNFLNPHLDNSHDKDMQNWRVLNLLYYATPNWKIENGGNLELWPKGLKNEPIIIQSKFNRLVVMATHQNSWHSVNTVISDDIRCCISNYYFSKNPLLVNDNFHVTLFRGRPSQKVKDFFLKVDNTFRNGIRKVFKKGIKENPHVYKK